MSQISPAFVAYFRVSTDKQGRSGLGLEAQIKAVESNVSRSQGVIIESFQEVESGRRNDRPELLRALALCRQKKAVLVIAKLDRLARNTAFIANLIESGVEFVVGDMPQANKLTLHIMAAIAEHEREATSLRTREALAAAKARGQKLGNPNPDLQAMQGAWSRKARQQRAEIYPTLHALRGQGMTLTAIAQELNARGVKSCNGRLWYASTVRKILVSEKLP